MPLFFATFAGVCGYLVGIGLARFSYTPLIPLLIEQRWFAAADVIYLSAANLAGYVAGALFGRPLAQRLGNRGSIRLAMALTTLSFFACAVPVSVAWFFFWRCLSGMTGGALMVLIATTVLPHVSPARRGVVGGIMFLGAGLGIIASGTLVPALLHLGLRETWLGLGVLSLVLTLVSWLGWPTAQPPAPLQPPRIERPARRGLRLLYGIYALNALGLVPGMVLLADFVARGLARGPEVGAFYWVLYGLGAAGGPVLCGLVGDRTGFGLAYRAGLVLQITAVLVLALTADGLLLGLSALFLGAITPGVAVLALGRIQELLPQDPAAQRVAWSRATLAFALFQALGAYGYSFLFVASGEDYALIFLCAAGGLAAALLADVAGLSARRRVGR